MATYDRNFLVPYLRDLCCTEMLVKKLEQDIPIYTKERVKYLDWANRDYSDPPKPNIKDYTVEADRGLFYVGLPCLILGFLLIWVPGISICAIMFGMLFLAMQKNKEKTALMESKEKYAQAMEVYNQEVAKMDDYRIHIPMWKAAGERRREKENRAKKDLGEAKSLRAKLYSLNIIPTQYRGIETAYYLYNYAGGSRETDVDKIIGFMLVDTIVHQLGEIIALKQEELLLKRREIAIEERRNTMIEENHREQMRRFAQMEVNQERQLDYQRMIEVNQEVTNFFLAADYLEKHR